MNPWIVLLVSAAAGFVGALGGMGGGVLLIPGLTLLGLEIKKAIALSVVSVIATSSGSASVTIRDRIPNLKIAMYLEVFTISGALVGAQVTVASPPRVLFLLLGVVLLASMALQGFSRRAGETSPDQPDAFARWLELSGNGPGATPEEAVPYHAARAYWAGPCMFLAGWVSGLLGIGAGALKVLIMDRVMRLPPKVSTTTSNVVIGVTALAGASVYLSSGWIDPEQAALVIVGILPGAYLGTRVLTAASDRTVTRVFRILLFVMGVEVIVRGLTGAR